MSWEFEIVFSPRATRDLKALEKSIQIRIKNAVTGLAYFPPKGDLIKLKGGQGGELRLRVGDWRVTFEYVFEERRVYILAIKHHRKALPKVEFESGPNQSGCFSFPRSPGPNQDY